MRRTLVKGAVAVTVMVILAFVIPLALTVRDAARTKAVAAAQQQAAALGPALAVQSDPVSVRATVGRERTGRVSVALPSGERIGTGRASAAQLELSKVSPVGAVSVPGGLAVLQPILLGERGTAVIEVFVPAETYSTGLTSSWLVLGVVGLALIVAAALVADRLAAQLVASTRRLAGTAHALGAGDLSRRVEVEGPPELRDVGAAFNAMADRIQAMLDGEREFAADVSHRLRTPLTALRLDVAHLPDGPQPDRVRAAVVALEREVDHVVRAARAGRQEPPSARSDLAEVVAERMRFWSALAGDEGRPVTVTLPEASVSVPMTRTDAVGVVDALVGNVFRHTGAGVPFAVRLDAPEGGSQVRLVVEDGGPGLPTRGSTSAAGGRESAAGTARYGTDATGSPVGSTGMGLALVGRRVADAGGSVDTGRGAMGGARVTLLLPPWHAGGAGLRERRADRHRSWWARLARLSAGRRAVADHRSRSALLR